MAGVCGECEAKDGCTIIDEPWVNIRCVMYLQEKLAEANETIDELSEAHLKDCMALAGHSKGECVPYMEHELAVKLTWSNKQQYDDLRAKVAVACGELLTLQHNICEGNNMDSDTTMTIEAIVEALAAEPDTEPSAPDIEYWMYDVIKKALTAYTTAEDMYKRYKPNHNPWNELGQVTLTQERIDDIQGDISEKVKAALVLDTAKGD